MIIRRIRGFESHPLRQLILKRATDSPGSLFYFSMIGYPIFPLLPWHVHYIAVFDPKKVDIGWKFGSILE